MIDLETSIKKLRKLQRRYSFLTLLEEIKNQKLSHGQREEMLERIFQEAVKGSITPQEQKQLTKAVMVGVR